MPFVSLHYPHTALLPDKVPIGFHHGGKLAGTTAGPIVMSGADVGRRIPTVYHHGSPTAPGANAIPPVGAGSHDAARKLQAKKVQGIFIKPNLLPAILTLMKYHARGSAINLIYIYSHEDGK